MRLRSVAATLLLAGCSAAPNPATEEAALEQVNAEIIQGLYDAFARGDIPAVVEGLAPDVEWIEAEGAPTAGTYRSPDEVLTGVFARLGGEWEGFAAVPSEILADGDRVIALGTYSGTYRETGSSFRAAFAHAWTVRDGRVTAFRQIADTEMMQRAIRRP